MALQQKIMSSFIGKVVRKDLAFLVKGGLPVPTYVLEYLLGQYCASDDEQAIENGLNKVKEIIQNNYVHRAEAESVKGKIRDNGKYRIIDKVTVVLNEKLDEYQACFANLGLSGVPIGTNYVKENPKLLSGNGVWCIVTIGYIPGEDVKVRWDIQTLKPIQISNVNVQEYIDQRKNFTTDEWIDFMIHTAGLNPDMLNRREKFISLARLLPHIENNFNFMELGPKGTGKSHVFQELSPCGVLVSGGDVTSARLFVKMSGNKELLGLVGYWDVVAWDEFEQQKGRNVDAVLIDTMQNYLANKSFNRGKATHEASASMCFVGNTKRNVPFMLKNSHLFESIPTSFIKGAFLDRIHLYNPGWEIRMLKKESFSQGYGLITDYIAAILHELRNSDQTSMLKEYVKFDDSLSERDHLAIRKVFSGMVKLLYPDGTMTKEEALELIDFAAEGRKRVKDQLYIIDETFRAEPAKFNYIILSTGQEIEVQTLELINNPTCITDREQTELAEEIVETEIEKKNGERQRISEEPLVRNIAVRENQMGISYRFLFGAYLQGATQITIEDPYIRMPYQIKNLLELLGLIAEQKVIEEEIGVHLVTWNTEERTPESIDAFDDIKESVAEVGIEFTYEFKEFHDRKITTNNGWDILLGRGLDIFEPRRGYSIEEFIQERRKCKAFTVTYLKGEK